ncbi:MAG: class I SAM-dependent methyltransferase [Clostridia bacterium]|nr:class I SAM-dependent methyltransferase [Clostridia bacterium]
MEEDIVRNQWNNVAQCYSSEQRESINNITNRTIIKELAGSVENLRLLDAGCGDGYLSSIFRDLGANVYAFDGSENFINLAKNEFKNINYQVCDIKKDLPFDDKFFDIIVSSLVLMDIDNIEPFFKEANRILNDDGKLIFSIVHPCYFQAEWEFDENGNKYKKKIYNYWDCNSEILNIWGETTHFHRPITYYSKIIKKYGFVIEELKENPDNKEVFDKMKPHQKRLPLFLCFSLRKINNT